jgi:hypothetical protein
VSAGSFTPENLTTNRLGFVHKNKKSSHVTIEPISQTASIATNAPAVRRANAKSVNSVNVEAIALGSRGEISS